MGFLLLEVLLLCPPLGVCKKKKKKNCVISTVFLYSSPNYNVIEMSWIEINVVRDELKYYRELKY